MGNNTTTSLQTQFFFPKTLQRMERRGSCLCNAQLCPKFLGTGPSAAPSPAHTLHFRWEFTNEDPNCLTGCLENSRRVSLRAYIFTEVRIVWSFTPVENGSKKLLLRSWAILHLPSDGINCRVLESGPKSLLIAHSRPTKPFPDYIHPHHLPVNSSHVHWFAL